MDKTASSVITGMLDMAFKMTLLLTICPSRAKASVHFRGSKDLKFLHQASGTHNLMGSVKEQFKAGEDGNDPYTALLEYRNTPISGLNELPALLLTAGSLLKPQVVDNPPKEAATME